MTPEEQIIEKVRQHAYHKGASDLAEHLQNAACEVSLYIQKEIDEFLDYAEPDEANERLGRREELRKAGFEYEYFFTSEPHEMIQLHGWFPVATERLKKSPEELIAKGLLRPLTDTA